jgi:hypothetical protein
MLHVQHVQGDSNGRLAAALICCVVAQVKETFPQHSFQKCNLYGLAFVKGGCAGVGEIDSLECTTASATTWY